MSEKKKSPEEIRADIRSDFIRRLFAVAISIGVATTLVRMDWIQVGRWPDTAEWQQVGVIFVALNATVGSWEGYLFSIHQRPLFDFWRFTIDIALVFIYMFLFLTSKNLSWWLPILAVIFSLYAIWDFLTVYLQTDKYIAHVPGKPDLRPSVGTVYGRGFVGDSRVGEGPIITLWWGAYLIISAALNFRDLESRVLPMCAFAIIGLWGYRLDKVFRFKMRRRIAAVLLLLLAQLMYLAFAHGVRVWPLYHLKWP